MKRAVLTFIFILFAVDNSLSQSDLKFIPDPGIRIDSASNPAASIDPMTGLVYLFYNSGAQRFISASSDGLNFISSRQPTVDDNKYFPFQVKLNSGIFCRYLFDINSTLLKRESSADGIHFKPDTGIRYAGYVTDNGTAGVHDEYVDPAGGVVCLYIGDMFGLNNIRRAYSPPGDDGMHFVFEDANVLGDANAGGGPNSYVDCKSILLPDGRRRLFVMKQGILYSFISTDGKSYILEPGIRLQPSDFTGLSIVSLHDPVVIRLSDGRYRMYVAGSVRDSNGKLKSVIVSAMSGATTYIENVPSSVKFILQQNYPNPFTSTTNITLTPFSPLPNFGEGKGERVTLKVYNIFGREVLDLSSKVIGNFTFRQGGNLGSSLVISQSQLPSNGIYFYRLTIGSESQTKIMVMNR